MDKFEFVKSSNTRAFFIRCASEIQALKRKKNINSLLGWGWNIPWNFSDDDVFACREQICGIFVRERLWMIYAVVKYLHMMQQQQQQTLEKNFPESKIFLPHPKFMHFSASKKSNCPKNPYEQNSKIHNSDTKIASSVVGTAVAFENSTTLKK